jgi:hypothetical protein
MEDALVEDHWLVRTAENVIAGPYNKEQICDLIRDGQLKLPDEICAANGHWFYLHEHEEVALHLGADISRRLIEPDAEHTQTQTETENNVEAMQLKAAEERLEGSDGSTGVISLTAPQAQQPRVTLNRTISTRAVPVSAPAPAPAVHVASSSERQGPSRVLILLLALVAVAAALSYFLLETRLRRPAPPERVVNPGDPLEVQPTNPPAPEH